MRKSICLLAILITFYGCGTSARIEKRWRDPEVTVDVSLLNKVLVVALLNNEANRRSTEDKLVQLLRGKGVQSYNYFTRKTTREEQEGLKEKLKDEGFDGVVIMRLADVDKDVQYVPGHYPIYYGRFWGYYMNAWTAWNDPGYYKTTKKYTVETNVYSLKRNKLIWSGITTSVDPSNLDRLMDVVAMTVYKEMQREGFLIGI